MGALENSRRWRAENRERSRELNRLEARRLKDKLVVAYGGRCACCGETERAFLTLDHVDGVPDSHRDANGKRKAPNTIYRLVLAEGCPPTCQVLCWNCNQAKYHYGICPHQRTQEEVA